MTHPPEGERPGGEEPFEGISPDELDGDWSPTEERSSLEPEFVEALREAAGEPQPEAHPKPDPQADPEPKTDPEQEADPEPKTDPDLQSQPEPSTDPEQPPDPEPPENPEPPPDPEQAEPALGGSAAPGAEQPIAEQPAVEPAAAQTVQFTPEEVAEAQEEGDEAPRRKVVIESGPAATAATTAAFEKPPPDGDAETAPKRKRIWLRFLIGSVLIIAAMAGATAASALIFLGTIAEDLGGLAGVKRQLLPPETGQPENILILGSDKRASLPGTRGLSDTTILLRLDPNNNSIALMSIPRDLKTYIPGVGTTKFNAAFAYGGPKLTLRVVKRITGLSINHVVNVDFLGFQRAVNAIGCVYVDVDRRYYHSNVGLPASLQYAEINVPPGYQRLCGKDALAYARYRHTDTDLVRAARQQDFLREARQQVPATDLFLTKRKELLDIFTTYTTSDISNGESLLQVLKLFVASRNAPIKEIHFPALLHPSYVTASKPAIDAAVENFLGIQASGGPRGSLDLPKSSANTGIVPEQRKRAKAKKKAKQGPKAPPTPTAANDGLVDAGQFSHDLAAKVAAKTLRSFPVFYPRRLPSGAIYVQVPRIYHLRDTDKQSRGAYKMVLQLPQGDYFGFQGVHGWTDPPILSHPSETRTIAGRDFDIFLDGDRVRLISWHQGDNSYWVSNSLLQTLSNDQMLGIARSIAKLPGERTKKPKRRGRK